MMMPLSTLSTLLSRRRCFYLLLLLLLVCFFYSDSSFCQAVKVSLQRLSSMDTVLLRCGRPGIDQDYVILQVPAEATFAKYLQLLSMECQQSISSFKYEDEEGDMILVASDLDLSAMLELYEIKQSDPDLAGPINVVPIRLNQLNLQITVDPDEDQTPTQHSPDDPYIPPSLNSFNQIQDDDLELLEILGHGNGGTVYRALHKPSEEFIAVKIIPLDATPAVQQKIHTELDILKRCTSDFIIGYFGCFFSENRIKICTEYMDGGSLDTFGSIPEPVLGCIAGSVLQGLEYLSSQQIMHRDLKPSNILINSAGSVKLCDFGVSTQLIESVTATFVGTNAYMAPERILGQPYTQKAEIWSFGLSIVELALGHFPYEAKKNGMSRALLPIELLQCIVNEPPPRLSEDDFSEVFIDFVARCLVKEAPARPSAGELLEHPFLLPYLHDDSSLQEWIHHIIEQRSQVVPDPG
eukprot:m.23206 g.23206  ORF g.23206 m.23206 type:complete len:466 (-) comp13109_c0_seq1:68-1465(-)